MTAFDWRPTGESDSKRFAEARVQLLSAAQWLARVERSFGDAGRGDELTLRWSDERDVIATHRFASDLGLELQIDDLMMQFTEEGRPSSHEIDVEERSPAHVEAWILIELLHRGVDRDRFSKDLPYDTSGMMTGDGVEFSPGAYQRELGDLAAWFRNGVSAIRRAADAGDGAGPLRISPSDLRVELVTEGGVFGFSPGDARIAEPYFYAAAKAGSGESAGVLRASEIPAQGSADKVLAFFASHRAPTRH